SSRRSVHRLDLRPLGALPPGARHHDAAALAAPSDHRARRRPGDPRRARRPSLPRLPRREARRIRALPPRRPPLGARRVPTHLLKLSGSLYTWSRRSASARSIAAPSSRSNATILAFPGHCLRMISPPTDFIASGLFVGHLQDAPPETIQQRIW